VKEADNGRSVAAASCGLLMVPLVMRVLHAFKRYIPDIGGIPEVISILSNSMGPDIESRVIVCGRTARRRQVKVNGIAAEKVPALGELMSMPLAPICPSP
jgi:hypothetical protein